MYALLTIVVLAAPPEDAVTTSAPAATVVSGESVADAESGDGAAVEALRGRQLARTVRAALRRWARPEDDQAQQAARSLLPLYRALRSDTELAVSHRHSLRQQVAFRLDRLAEQIAEHGARRRASAASAETGDSGGWVEVDTEPEEVDDPPGVAQFGQFGVPGGQVGFGVQGRWGGGMAAGAFGAAPRGGTADDYGDELVDLIQTTIRPDTWARNGGPGTIYYWRNQRAIVVRNKGEVHHDVGNVLEQMRRAGR